MLEKFTKSLGFLQVNANNTNHVHDEKFMFKFEDELINKHWLCFLAAYTLGMNQGRINTLNEISIDCMKKLEPL